MDSKVNYILVGFFVLLLGAALLAGVLWFSTGGIHGSYRQYVMYTTESVSGLNSDAAVRYNGVKVGRVADIGLAPGDPGKVRLLLDVETGTPVKTDTVATLEMLGLTGLMNVNLVGGSPQAKPLTARPGEIPVIPSKPSLLGQINDKAEMLVANLNETSERINRLLSDENQRALSRSLAHLEKVTRSLAAEAETITETLNQLGQAARSANLVGEKLPETLQQFHQTAAALERMANEIGSASRAVGEEVATNGTEIQRFLGETLPTAGAMVDELREAAASLRRASETLERDPSVLIYGSGAPAPGPGE